MEGGQTMLIFSVFFLFISLAIALGMSAPAILNLKNARDTVFSKQSYFAAESAIEDAYLRLKNGKQLGSTFYMTINGATATGTVVTAGSNKEVTVIGDANLRQRKLFASLKVGTGIAFYYGIQSGNGGFYMANNSQVTGNVYSNGQIIGNDSSHTFITGSAVSAGSSGAIKKVGIGTGSAGDAWANTVQNTTVAGALYCTSGTGNNKACDTSRGDAPPVAMPVTDEQIAAWKAVAEAGGVISGNVSPSGTLTIGPKKINGNLTLNNNDVLILTGAVWVTGTITTNNHTNINLGSAYGSDDGILITDKYASISNDTTFNQGGIDDSFIILVATSDCPTTTAICGGNNAISVQNNAGAVILYAPYGTLSLSNNASLSSAAAYKINLSNNANIVYDFGVVDSNFVSGPSGGWNMQSLQEIE